MGKKLWNKDFILLLQGNAVSTIGDLMYSVAIGYWVYEKTGSSALSALLYGVLGDVFELHLVFAVGSLLSLGPMLYMCFHPRTKEFVLEH